MSHSEHDPPVFAGETPNAQVDSHAQDEEHYYEDLTPLVERARRGLRSDVAALAAALPTGGLLVPLATPIVDVPLGEPVSLEQGEVSLSPHLLPDQDGACFVALFTDADVLETVGKYLGWKTPTPDSAAGEPADLQYCTLPAPAALDLALQLIDNDEIQGLVINPSDEHELLLQRHEVGALSQGQGIPLVGYVKEIPISPDEVRLISEPDAPLDQTLQDAIRLCVSQLPGVQSHRVEQSFNRERDLEPHLTLTLCCQDPDSVDSKALNLLLSEHLENKLPPPGYIDVLFEFPRPSGAN